MSDLTHSTNGVSLANVIGATALTMSSLEIAELTGKQHDNVRRDIKNMGEKLSLTFEEKSEASAGGRPSRVYHLPKRETLILVSGYDVSLRAKIIDRWQELEQITALPLTREQFIAQALSFQQEIIAEKDARIADLEPKAEAFDELASLDGLFTLTQAAKACGWTRDAFIHRVHAMEWIYRDKAKKNWLGYAPKEKSGYLDYKPFEYKGSDGTIRTKPQVVFTAKGLAKIRVLIGEQPKPLRPFSAVGGRAA